MPCESLCDKIADTGYRYVEKLFVTRLGGESESKENRKQKKIEKLQIMSKLCKTVDLNSFFAIEILIQNLSGYPGTSRILSQPRMRCTWPEFQTMVEGKERNHVSRNDQKTDTFSHFR